MHLDKFLIEFHSLIIWSFFIGLILASVYFVGKQVTKWNFASSTALILGAAIAFYITTLPSSATNENPYFLFLAGAIAICAMILPGISGSFILLILGAYKTLSDAIHDIDIKKIALFALGAIIGLLSFSRVLKWLFKHYRNLTLAVLTGFILGSLNEVWPWKASLSIMEKSSGSIIPISDISNLGTLSVYQAENHDFESYKQLTEESILPLQYSEINNYIEPQTFPAIGLMVVGFLIIFLIEKIGSKSTK
jgi:putative membrane protein